MRPDVSSNPRSVLIAARTLPDAGLLSGQFDQHRHSSLPAITGNAQRLEQVVINLIVNACQALQDKDRAIRLVTRVDAAQQWIALEISDEGCGIDKADLARITDPFFTTRREQGGTGLGLAISQRIVQDHGGRMIFESTRGKGTAVLVEFPVNPSQDPMAKERENRER